MAKMDVVDALENTIRDPELQDTAAAMAEVAFDSLFSAGILRDVPIIGSILGLGRTAISIQERLFIGKLHRVLTEIESVPTFKRKEMVDQINGSAEFELRVGEKLLYIIDRCEDRMDAQNIGQLFRAFLEHKISYGEFLRLSRCVDRVMPDDLKTFVNSDWERISVADANHLLGTGLIELEDPEIRAEDQWDHKSSNRYIVFGGELSVHITDLGRVMRQILCCKTTKDERAGATIAG